MLMTNNPASQNSSIDEGAVAASTPFSGNPKLYRRIAVWGSLGVHAYLFFGYWAIKVFLAGEEWPTGWFAPVATLVSTLWFARFSYRWMMRLDAQYGRGSGWQLDSVSVKLPTEKPRKKK